MIQKHAAACPASANVAENAPSGERSKAKSSLLQQGGAPARRVSFGGDDRVLVTGIGTAKTTGLCRARPWLRTACRRLSHALALVDTKCPPGSLA